MPETESLDPTLVQRLLDESNDGVVVAEREGDDHIMIYVNRAFERLTGYSREEILYQDCRFLQGDDRDQEAVDRIRSALQENRPCREIIRNYRKDGSLFWNELSITPVVDDRDQLTYYIGIQKDVTAQVRAEHEVERLRQELDELRRDRHAS